MELWDVYDVERRLTGRTMRRQDAMKPGDYHLVVHVCIFGQGGKMLIAQRQPWKKGWPGMWDYSVAGSALAGESSRQAAQRETREEIGLELDLSRERPYLTIHYDHGFDDFYLLRRELDIAALTPQPEEVRALRWAGLEEILRMQEEGLFIDYYFTPVLFEMCGRRGSHRR